MQIKGKEISLKNLIFGNPSKSPAPSGIPYPEGTQGEIPILDIQSGVILTTDGKYVKLLEIFPTNYRMKNLFEQKNIIYYFLSWLRIAPPDFQILVRVQRADIEAACEYLGECYGRETQEACQTLILEEAGLIRYLAENEALSHRFFLCFAYDGGSTVFEDIVKKLEEDALTAEQYLGYCGLTVRGVSDGDQLALDILYSMLNKRTSLHVELPNAEELLSPICGEYEGDENEIPAGGRLSKLDLIAPSSMELNHRDYVIVDGVYHSYVILTGYPSYLWQTDAWLVPFLEAGEGISLSFFVNRIRKEKILPKISRKTMLNRSRFRSVDVTRQDFEEMDDAIDSGLYIKDAVNRGGEQFHYMHTLIEITADSEGELKRRISRVETLCGSNRMTCRRTDFKQEQAFLSMLPLTRLDPDLELKSRRNVLTNGIAASFPFCSYELCDPKGIFLGINLENNSATLLDVSDSSKYSNGNMSIMGTSGAGKTFLLQLLALRLRMQGVQVFILAPIKGFEFRAACEAVGGSFLKLSPGSENCINFLEIRRACLDPEETAGESRGDSVLMEKIRRLHIFFSLRLPDMTQEETRLLDQSLLELYGQFGITQDNASLLTKDRELKPSPTFRDLYRLLRERGEEYSRLAGAVEEFAIGSVSSLGGATNIDVSSKYIVIDMSELGKDLLPEGMLIATDFVSDEGKKSRIARKAVIFDEFWEIIGARGNQMAADFILELFKVFRAYSGIAVNATQDLIDYFAFEDGKYGKAILNVCRIKIVLQMEENEAREVQKYLNLSDEETLRITRCQRGQGLVCIGPNRINVEFRASQSEYALLTTDRNDLLRVRKGEYDDENSGQ